MGTHRLRCFLGTPRSFFVTHHSSLFFAFRQWFWPFEALKSYTCRSHLGFFHTTFCFALFTCLSVRLLWQKGSRRWSLRQAISSGDLRRVSSLLTLQSPEYTSDPTYHRFHLYVECSSVEYLGQTTLCLQVVARLWHHLLKFEGLSGFGDSCQVGST